MKQGAAPDEFDLEHVIYRLQYLNLFTKPKAVTQKTFSNPSILKISSFIRNYLQIELDPQTAELCTYFNSEISKVYKNDIAIFQDHFHTLFNRYIVVNWPSGKPHPIDSHEIVRAFLGASMVVITMLDTHKACAISEINSISRTFFIAKIQDTIEDLDKNVTNTPGKFLLKGQNQIRKGKLLSCASALRNTPLNAYHREQLEAAAPQLVAYIQLLPFIQSGSQDELDSALVSLKRDFIRVINSGMDPLDTKDVGLVKPLLFYKPASLIEGIVKCHLGIALRPHVKELITYIDKLLIIDFPDEIFSYQLYLLVLFERYVKAKWPVPSQLPSPPVSKDLIGAYLGALIISLKISSEPKIRITDISDHYLVSFYLFKLAEAEKMIKESDAAAGAKNNAIAILAEYQKCLKLHTLSKDKLSNLDLVVKLLPKKFSKKFKALMQNPYIQSDSRAQHFHHLATHEVDFIQTINCDLNIFCSQAKLSALVLLGNSCALEQADLALTSERDTRNFVTKLAKYTKTNSEPAMDAQTLQDYKKLIDKSLIEANGKKASIRSRVLPEVNFQEISDKDAKRRVIWKR